MSKAIHSIEDLVTRLAQARQDKGLTQSELGERVRLPQSHISRIERGQVDLRASNLIELARSLDLEVVLVPRQFVQATRLLLRDESDDAPLYQLRKG